MVESTEKFFRISWDLIGSMYRLSMAINFDPLLANKIDPLAYR